MTTPFYLVMIYQTGSEFVKKPWRNRDEYTA